MNKRSICIAVIILFMAGFSEAQTGNRTQLSMQPESKLWLEGTSTMHEYSARASQLLGTIVVDSMLFVEGEVDSSKLFQQVEVTIPVKMMLSGNEKLDNNMYGALKVEDHPTITYQMTRDSIISVSKDSITVRTTGKLAVAGKEKVIDMLVTILKNPDSTLSIKGSKELLMTEFNIEPPSMMFGLLKTDNKVVIHFALLVKACIGPK